MLTAHRLVQLNILLDNLESTARVQRRGAANLRRIGNHTGAGYLLAEAERRERLAMKIKRRLRMLPFAEFAQSCPNRVEPALTRRPSNALNIEIGSPADRCLYRSPDGLGLRWYLSGGSILNYGPCEHRCCPDYQDRG